MTGGRPIAFACVAVVVAGTAVPSALAADERGGTLSGENNTTATDTSVREARAGAATTEPGPKPANLSVHLHGVHHGRVGVGERMKAVGYLRPFVADQHVEVTLVRNGHVIRKRNPAVERVAHQNAGRYRFHSPRLVKPGHYRVIAVHRANLKQGRDVVRSDRFHISYPDLDPGDRRREVRIFNRLLLRRGYYTTHGRRYGVRTRWAVMAFRKVNGMKRTDNANPGIFKRLADGRGRFHLDYPGAGRHVEVDISRQVMALAAHRKAQYTFPVSTGAPATPTIRGHFRFYSRQPGYNSHGMYYAVYFHGGYATHGYDPVPRYPASHGCVRNPIPDSIFIYRWVRLGMSIYVYR